MTLEAREYLVLSSGWGCHNATLVVDLEVGEVSNLADLISAYQDWDPRASWEAFGTDGLTRVLLAASTPKMPRSLVVIEFTRGLEEKKITLVEEPRMTKKGIYIPIVAIQIKAILLQAYLQDGKDYPRNHDSD